MNYRWHLALIGLLAAIASVAFAAAPAWWSDTTNGTAFIDANATVNNYAPLNIGQLKNVATKAKAYLDIQLALIGGSGANITTLVDGFTNNSTADYSPANLGQLKAVAQPFYDRLNAIGYNTTANLIAQGYPGNWTSSYPWSSSTPTSANYVPANIGQLKMVFSFYLPDTDGDGLNDIIENILGTDPNLADSDGDGVPDGQDAFPLDPTRSVWPSPDPDDHTPPTITLLSPSGATPL
jgi:Bacterial TSP3 repeat